MKPITYSKTHKHTNTHTHTHTQAHLFLLTVYILKQESSWCGSKGFLEKIVFCQSLLEEFSHEISRRGGGLLKIPIIFIENKKKAARQRGNKSYLWLGDFKSTLIWNSIFFNIKIKFEIESFDLFLFLELHFSVLFYSSVNLKMRNDHNHNKSIFLWLALESLCFYCHA